MSENLSCLERYIEIDLEGNLVSFEEKLEEATFDLLSQRAAFIYIFLPFNYFNLSF